LHKQTICDDNYEAKVAIYLYSVIVVISRFLERLQGKRHLALDKKKK
jgi:hypothetical protein